MLRALHTSIFTALVEDGGSGLCAMSAPALSVVAGNIPVAI